jgi:hypothetical protein
MAFALPPAPVSPFLVEAVIAGGRLLSDAVSSAVAVVAMISSSEEFFQSALARLSGDLGPCGSICAVLPFDFTRYYEKEMGTGLLRTYAVFDRRVPEDKLKAIKRMTTSLEGEFLHPGTDRRRINLDPGILTPDHLVLASHKSASHRVYLGDGVYAELELLYQNGGFQPLPWTYPDYRTAAARDFFKEARSTLMEKRQTRS